jgi:hypothetical protein
MAQHRPLLFVQQYPDDSCKNARSVNAAEVKSHLAKSYRYVVRPPSTQNLKSPHSQISKFATGWRSNSPVRTNEVFNFTSPQDHRLPDTCQQARFTQGLPRRVLPSPRPSPSVLPDIFRGPRDERRLVFDYYLTAWWPPSNGKQSDSGVFGFTPIHHGDNHFVNTIVSAALNHPSTLSLEAILASAASRMQLVHQCHFADPHLAQALHLQAIRSLRARLNHEDSVDESLIIDLSKLIYAELFTKSGPPGEVLWTICKHAIVKIGGFAKVSTLTALAALSTDFFVSNAKLRTPTLDVYACPELLGIDPASPHVTDLDSFLRSTIVELDPRCRTIIDLAHCLGPVYASLWSLPSIKRTLQSLQFDRPKLAKNLRSPLVNTAPENSASDPVSEAILEADCEALQLKMYMFNAYLAFSSLNEHVIEAPLWAQEVISSRWQRIDLIVHLLRGSDWNLRQDHLLWVAAIGIFTSSSFSDLEAYRRIFQQAASNLGLTCANQIGAKLGEFLSLEYLPGFNMAHLTKLTKHI